MIKSKSQSKQASFCTTISMKLPTLFQHQLTYLKQHSENGGPNYLFKQTKKTKQSKQKLRRSKNNTTVHEIIKTKCLERPEIFIDEEGDALGIPKL